MPTYLVYGASRETGEDQRITVTADTSADARAVANARGILVAGVEQTAAPAAEIEVRTGSSPALTLGIIATVLAVLAMLVGWVPFLGVVTLPVAVLALLLGLLGCFLAPRRGGARGLAMPLLGVALSCCAIALPLLSTAGSAELISATRQSMADAQAALDADMGAAGSEHVSTEAPPEAQAAAAEWKPGGVTAEHGGFEVSLVDVQIGRPMVRSLGEEWQRDEASLIVIVEVVCRDATVKGRYVSWRGDDSFYTLTDDFGNRYDGAYFGYTDVPVGGVLLEPLYPDKPVGDVLAFECPIPKATELTLSLKARNFGGGDGSVVFKIPTSLIPSE